MHSAAWLNFTIRSLSQNPKQTLMVAHESHELHERTHLRLFLIRVIRVIRGKNFKSVALSILSLAQVENPKKDVGNEKGQSRTATIKASLRDFGRRRTSADLLRMTLSFGLTPLIFRLRP